MVSVGGSADQRRRCLCFWFVGFEGDGLPGCCFDGALIRPNSVVAIGCVSSCSSCYRTPVGAMLYQACAFFVFVNAERSSCGSIADELALSASSGSMFVVVFLDEDVDGAPLKIDRWASAPIVSSSRWMRLVGVRWRRRLRIDRASLGVAVVHGVGHTGRSFSECWAITVKIQFKRKFTKT